MNVGTKSILFGVHQFIWHPITVYMAWKELYGRPTWKEIICIIIHDWGYWGSPNMDGVEGERHPEWAAKVVSKYLGQEYEILCLFHSRHYARIYDATPSKLCWADKLSIKHEPAWWYLFRARLSGELKEYRENAHRSGHVPKAAKDRSWFNWIKWKLQKLGEEQRGDAVPYQKRAG